MADVYSNVAGQLNQVTFGGADLGANAVVTFPELYELEPVSPDSMGGEVLTYLIRKKEVVVSVTFHETSATVMAAAFGAFWGGASASIDDTYSAGYNAGASGLWTKALVISPKGGGSAGRLTLELPYATPVGKQDQVGNGRNITTTIVFKAIRGGGAYVAKVTRS